MDPPLRERLGRRTSSTKGITVPGSPAATARGAIWLGSAAVASILIGVVLPHHPEMDERAVLAAAGGGLLLVAAAIAFYGRIPRAAVHMGLAAASGLATLTVANWGGEFYGAIPYLWVTLFAFYLMTRAAALAHMALIGVLYGVYLGSADTTGYTPIGSWAATIGALLICGLLVASLRDRLAGQVLGLSDAARRDPLTALYNRRGFEEALDVELERARRTGQSLSVVIGDLDAFKALNDEFGHAAGDQALRQVGAALRASKRSWDVAARIGGEEFAIVAPDTDEHGAYILAERARANIEQAFGGGSPGPLSISFGIAAYPVHGQTADALLEAADQALYAAKRLGRNRSVISSAEVAGILARSRAREQGTVELAMLLSLAEALDVRDSGSPSHCRRVGRFAELIARELGLSADAIERVRLAGILHDVGRVGVPDALFEKPGPLSDDEWEKIRSHPEIGARMLETTDFADLGEWILAHHERPDGTGYPRGRSGGEVPLEAAIIGVADAYEAMTARRAYRPALGADVAGAELRRGAGVQFDEQVVDALLRVV